MQQVITNVEVVNKATIQITLETREEIESFKTILRLADFKLRDQYVGGGDSAEKKMLDLFKAEIEKQKL